MEKRKKRGKERKKMFFVSWSVKVVVEAYYHRPKVFLVLSFFSKKFFEKNLTKMRIFLKFKIISFRRLFPPTLGVKIGMRCFFGVPRHCTWSLCKPKIKTKKSIFFDFCPDITFLQTSVLWLRLNRRL